MHGKIIIDGNSVYEIDESCIEKKKNAVQVNQKERHKETGHSDARNRK